MTDHQYVELHPGSAQRINGHEPRIGGACVGRYADHSGQLADLAAQLVDRADEAVTTDG